MHTGFCESKGDGGGSLFCRDPGERFEQGKTYGYHFSDREGGEDMAPNLSSTVKQPEKEKEVEEEGELNILYLILPILVLVLLAVIIILQRGKGKELGEE